MKSLILACCLFAASLAHAAGIDPALVRQVNAFVDGWHDDAAHARMRFFDKPVASSAGRRPGSRSSTTSCRWRCRTRWRSR
jgi:hypothetical protein